MDLGGPSGRLSPRRLGALSLDTVGRPCIRTSRWRGGAPAARRRMIEGYAGGDGRGGPHAGAGAGPMHRWADDQLSAAATTSRKPASTWSPQHRGALVQRAAPARSFVEGVLERTAPHRRARPHHFPHRHDAESCTYRLGGTTLPRAERTSRSPMSRLLDSLPELYRELLPGFFRQDVPEETKATCSNCAMQGHRARARGGRRRRQPLLPPRHQVLHVLPRLPNYLVSALLSDDRPERWPRAAAAWKRASPAASASRRSG